ncbi:MAG: galactose ABC transporter substrate-binding protein [Spirochaetaceae bacterium]|nr:galactose ABC transporter substrate-binding protein [Spirochaetaceae bacterium]
MKIIRQRKMVLTAFFVLALAPCVFAGGRGQDKPVAGVCWYNFADTFIANARSTLNKAAQADGAIVIRDADSLGEIPTQTSNVNNLLTQGVNILAVNNINFSGKAELITLAKNNNIPLLIINSDSPSEAEFALYDPVYHISSVADQSGRIMAEHAVKYWKAHPEADRNKNGKLDYVMLLGLVDHYDTQARAKYSIEGVQAAGISTNLVQEAICSYQRNEAQNQVASILQARQDDVEFIFACSDDMALGAIEALKAAGFFKGPGTFMPVVSVDATAVAVQAIKEGTLLGTALNNPVILGNATYKVMKLLLEGKEINDANLAIPGTRVVGHHVYIDFVPIDAGNTAAAAY